MSKELGAIALQIQWLHHVRLSTSTNLDNVNRLDTECKCKDLFILGKPGNVVITESVRMCVCPGVRLLKCGKDICKVELVYPKYFKSGKIVMPFNN